MRSCLFDSSIIATAQQAVEFVGTILESSTEYSVIGEDLRKDPVLEPRRPANVLMFRDSTFR